MTSAFISGGTQSVDLLAAASVASIAVATTGVAYSQSFYAPKNKSFGLEYQFTSSGVTGVTIELEHSNSLPGTEASSDTNFVIGDSVSDIATAVADELVHFVAVSPVVCSYIRFKFTGVGANDASTVVSRLKLNLSRNA